MFFLCGSLSSSLQVSAYISHTKITSPTHISPNMTDKHTSDEHTYKCNVCSCPVPLQVCKGNNKGNAGCLYASCNAVQADGLTCKYFHWASPKASPTSSQAPSPTLTAPSTLATLMGASQALANIMPSAITFLQCWYPNCTSTHIARGCEQHSCHKHCRQSGGCLQPGHTVSTSSTSTSRNKGKARAVSHKNSHSPEPSSFTISQLLPTLLPPPSCAPVDTCADPPYASQMPPVFTQQYAQEQELAEQHRLLDAEWLVNTQHACHHVLAYCWPKVCCYLHLLAVTNILDVQNRSEPTTVLFQDGFQWPHFILTIDVLCELDLSSLTGELVDICVKLYNSSLCTCTKVKPGFVIPMKEAQPILLKGLDVTDYPDLNCIISTAFSNHKPHLHSNLSNECSHVHHKLRELQHTSASTSVLMLDNEVEVEFAMSHAHVPTKRLITPAVSLDQSAIYQMFIQPKLWFPQHPLPSAPSMKPPLMRMLLSSPPMMRACRVFKSKRHSCQMKRRNTQHMHLWSANHHPNDVVILYWSANHHPQCLMTCCHQPNVLILYCHHPPPHSHWHWALDTLATMQLWLTMSLSGLLISML